MNVFDMNAPALVSVSSAEPLVVRDSASDNSIDVAADDSNEWSDFS